MAHTILMSRFVEGFVDRSPRGEVDGQRSVLWMVVPPSTTRTMIFVSSL